MSAARAPAAPGVRRVRRRVEIRPSWPVRLPRSGARDGTSQVRAGVLHRLLVLDGRQAVVRAAQPARDRVVIGAEAADAGTAERAIERVRFELGIDDDLRPFYTRFRDDPLLGASLRRRPHRRPRRAPDPFQALAWAICEQLIESERAAAIERAIVRALGPRCPATGLRAAPDAATLAAQAPARLEACGLSARRSLALVRAAREVAAGRIDLDGPDHETGWRRLREIPTIGRWTVETMALHGQGRFDQLPAGDLDYLKLVGRLTTGDPRARATEEEVRAFMAPYAPYAGLAAAHLGAVARGRGVAGAGRPLSAARRWGAGPAPAAARS